MNKKAGRRIVLAYSGGLNGSVAIRTLVERSSEPAEVVTVTLDVGQSGDLEEVRDRALAIGAVRAHVLDVREEFAREHVLRALKADAVADDGIPMVSGLSAPIVARKLVEIAAIEQAETVAHGASNATASRIELGARTLNPALTIMAPARDWTMTRSEAIDFAAARNLPVAATPDAPYSADAHLWGRIVACGAVDAWSEPPEELFTLTHPASACPAEPAYVDVSFERGVPVAVNGVPMPLIEIIETVSMIAGAHGVGRLDVAGSPGRDVAEAPAAVVLHAAHAELQKLVASRDAARLSRRVSREYADLIERGTWFSPLREALDAYVDRIDDVVNGDIRVKLFKGDARIVGRKPADAPQPAKRLRVVSKAH